MKGESVLLRAEAAHPHNTNRDRARSLTLIGSDSAALSPMTSLQWWTPMFHSIYLLRSRTTSAVGGVLGVGCWLLAVRASVVIFWARD